MPLYSKNLRNATLIHMDILDSVNSADLLVVGAGLFGLTIAERVANELNKKVMILERRNHVGGNAYSYFDETSGIEIHKYGSHLFHTSNEKIWEYVNRFTSFNSYVHKVFSIHNGNVFSLPTNLLTFAQVHKRYLTPTEAMDLVEKSKSRYLEKFANLEDKAISLVGEEIYFALIKNYTEKQWQTDPKEIPSEVISRLPVRFNFDNRYFDDKWEGLPLEGYGKWFSRMLDSKNIEVRLGQDYLEIKAGVEVPTVYTGPMDKYFNYSDGQLGWRTLDFEFESLAVDDFQGTSVMNYSDLDVKFTRIHEFKHLHPERKHRGRTVICREYSRLADKTDEPYYPINSKADREMVDSYRERIKIENKKLIFFGGRLGTYKYLDMHMAIASALSFYENQLKRVLV